VRLFDRSTPQHPFLLDPASLVRWVYVGRLSIASAIFLAAVLVWQSALTDTSKLLVASLAFAATLGFTACSVIYSEFYQRPLRPTFYYLQCVFDLLLVTAVVHVTDSSNSQFAALYILVIATSSLLLRKPTLRREGFARFVMALSGARQPVSRAPSLARQALSSVEIGPLYRRQRKAVRLWRFRRLSLPFVDWGRAFEVANCSAPAAALGRPRS